MPREDAPLRERVRFRANESRAGLTSLQAITVGTKNGARLLGAADEIGTLMPGHEASFIVLEKDPSADIRNTETIRAVWKAGKQVSADRWTAGRDSTVRDQGEFIVRCDRGDSRAFEVSRGPAGLRWRCALSKRP